MKQFKFPGGVLPVLVLLLATQGFAMGKAGPQLSKPTVDAGERLSLLHSHNDYRQKRPLADALAQGFQSVEADVWLVGDELKVSHLGFKFRGKLRDLYLEPLQRRVDASGSVYGDGQPFYLWLDLKFGDAEMDEVLDDLLSRYPMLTVFTDEEVRPGPVTVILTGTRSQKMEYVNQRPFRRACRDDEKLVAAGPPSDNRWLWYSLSWKKYFDWNGEGTIPSRERRKLEKIVAEVRKQGRRLRFYKAPEKPNVWNEALAAGVDMIGTNDLPKLREFVTRTRSPAATGSRLPLDLRSDRAP